MDRRQKSLQRFHDNHAQISENITKAKSHFNRIAVLIRDELHAKPLFNNVHLEFTGSSYEGVNIDKHKIELDIMLVCRGHDLRAIPTNLSGYERLLPKNWKNFAKSRNNLEQLERDDNFEEKVRSVFKMKLPSGNQPTTLVHKMVCSKMSHDSNGIHSSTYTKEIPETENDKNAQFNQQNPRKHTSVVIFKPITVCQNDLLRYRSRSHFGSLVGIDGLLSSSKFVDKFSGEIETTIRKLSGFKVKVTRNGSAAVRLEITTSTPMKGKFCKNKQPKLGLQAKGMPTSSQRHRPFRYEVDLVPCFLLANEHYYVAKQPVHQNTELDGQIETTWRRSSSMEEKDLLKKADKQDGGCRRQVLRIIKAIRLRDSTLMGLSSYHFKTCLIQEIREQPDWNIQNMAQRFCDVLRRLETSLKCGHLDHFWENNNLDGRRTPVNLLAKLSPTAKEDIRKRIRNIRIYDETLDELTKRMPVFK